jgi:hypothetical protein
MKIMQRKEEETTEAFGGYLVLIEWRSKQGKSLKMADATEEEAFKERERVKSSRLGD